MTAVFTLALIRPASTTSNTRRVEDISSNHTTLSGKKGYGKEICCRFNLFLGGLANISLGHFNGTFLFSYCIPYGEGLLKFDTGITRF